MLKAEEAKNPRSETQSGRMTVYFLTLYRFQGSRKARTECTLKTAQPDGKHLVKKPVAKNNFAVGLRISESKNNL